MDTRKRIVKSIVLLFMVFAMIFSTSNTFAYFSSGVRIEDTNQTSSTVRIGEWSQVYEWQQDTTYYEGERVTYNGVTYEAKKRNTNLRPESDENRNWPSYWRKL